MIKKLLISACILLFVSSFCADYCFSAASLGVKFASGTNRIRAIANRSPADKGRLRAGDKIIEINGTPVDNALDINLMLFDAFPEEEWEIKYERKGRTRKCDVYLAESNLTPEDVIIKKQVIKGDNIVLVFVPLGINVISARRPELIDEYKESTKNRILGRLESEYSNMSKRYPNISIVDRANLEELLDEIDFSTSGYISEKVRKQMGKLLGATHIYGITYSKNMLSEGTMEEIWTRKLIEIETGRIVSASLIERVTSLDGNVLSESNSWEFDDEKYSRGHSRRDRHIGSIRRGRSGR